MPVFRKTEPNYEIPPHSVWNDKNRMKTQYTIAIATSQDRRLRRRS